VLAAHCATPSVIVSCRNAACAALSARQNTLVRALTPTDAGDARSAARCARPAPAPRGGRRARASPGQRERHAGTLRPRRGTPPCSTARSSAAPAPGSQAAREFERAGRRAHLAPHRLVELGFAPSGLRLERKKKKKKK
jgi:hypothetical protein